MDFAYIYPTQEPYLNPEEAENSQEIPLSHSITSRLFYLAATVDRYYTPVLFLFGTIGNFLSIIVFFSKSHNARGSLSSSVYLSALAISDTGFLINLFVMWLDNMGTNLLTVSCICKTVMYTAQVTGFLSVWFIVAFTCERFFIVCFPLFRHSKCTASRAKKIATSLTIFAVVAFSYVWVIAEVQAFRIHPKRGDNFTSLSSEMVKVSHESWFLQSTSTTNRSEHGMQANYSSNGVEIFQDFKYKGTSDAVDPNEGITNKEISEHNEPELAYFCSVGENHHHISRVYSYIDSVLTFIVPFVLISVLNLKIIFCVQRIKGQRESMLASTRIRHKQLSVSEEEKPKLRDFFSTFHYIKNTAGTRNTGKKCRRPKEAVGCRKSGGETSASCSSSNSLNKNRKHPHRAIESNGMTSLLENVPSIESDSQSSPGEVTPPFKPVTPPAVTPTATEIRVTKTLLLVSTIFLILHLPSHSIRVAAFIESIGSASKETLQQINVAQHWANILFNTNFGINFLLYCCSGKAFRRSIKNLFSKEFFFARRSRNRSPGNASTTVLTTQLTQHSDTISGKYSTRILRHQSASGEEFEEDQL